MINPYRYKSMSNNADKQKAGRLVKAGFVGVMVYFAVIIGFSRSSARSSSTSS